MYVVATEDAYVVYVVATEDTYVVYVVATGPNIVHGMQLQVGGCIPSLLALLVQKMTHHNDTLSGGV